MIYLILQLFISATIDECLVCSWPYVSTLNSQGQCIAGYAYQTNLSQSCYAYCNTWAAQAETSQTSQPVYSFHDASPVASVPPYCECYRLNRGAYVSHQIRPQNTCAYGVSDMSQAYNDPTTVTTRNQQNQITTVLGRIVGVQSRLDSVRQIIDQGEQAFAAAKQSLSAGGIYVPVQPVRTCDAVNGYNVEAQAQLVQNQHVPGEGYGFANNGTTFQFSLNSSFDVSSGYNFVYPAYHADLGTITCAELMDPSIAVVQGLAKEQTNRFNQVDSQLQIIADGVRGLGNGMTSGFATVGSQIQSGDSLLLYRINSSVGGSSGEGTDVTPVVDAVNSASDTSTSHWNIDRHSADSSYYRASGLMDSTVRRGGNDTSGYGARLHTIFGGVQSQWTSDSTDGVHIFDGSSSCSDLPSDPYFTMDAFGPTQRVSIPISSSSVPRNTLLFIKWICKFLAVYSAGMIYYFFIARAMSLNPAGK